MTTDPGANTPVCNESCISTNSVHIMVADSEIQVRMNEPALNEAARSSWCDGRNQVRHRRCPVLSVGEE
jgi:hypothetical protein